MANRIRETADAVEHHIYILVKIMYGLPDFVNPICFSIQKKCHERLYFKYQFLPEKNYIQGVQL